MKKAILALFFIIVIFYFLPASPDSRLSQIKSSVFGSFQSIGKSKADFREELKNKTAELEAYENALVKVEEDIRRMEANIPTCPRTGQKGTLTITQDPRPELHERINKAKEEVASLKKRIGD
ncbi:MAG: hypothetical protein WC539_10085 [Nitrospirota bacterium]